GVLLRFTVQGVAAGQTDLTVDSELEKLPYPAVFSADANLDPYGVSTLQNARLAVGEPCTGAPSPTHPTKPTPTPEPSPTPCPSGQTCGTPVASRVPAGNASLAVDAVPTGNEATKVGKIETCASATVSD